VTAGDFAAHLFAVAVALGAAIVLFRDRAWGSVGRAAGGLGFLTLAAGEAVTGAGLFAEPATISAGLRTAGFGLLLIGALPGSPRTAELSATAAISAVVAVPPALPEGIAGAAAVAVAWRRRRVPGVVPLVAGLALLAGAEAATEVAPESALALRVAGYLGVALFVSRAVRSSIRLRFASAMVGLLVVVGLVASFLVASVLGQNIRRAALDQVARQAEEAAGELPELVTAETRKLVVVAEEALPAFRRGAAFPEAEMRSLMNRLFPGVRFILLLSARGQVLGRAGLSRAEAVELISVDVVLSALRLGRLTASLDTLGERRLVLVGAAPVQERDRTLGVAVAGYVLDRSVLERIAGAGNLSAVFRRANPVPVATNGFPSPRRRPVIERETLQSLWEGFLFGAKTSQRSLKVSGIDTFAGLTALRRSDGEAVGILLVAQRAGPVSATQRLLNRLLFAATVVLFGLAFLLAALVARRITGPVVSLTGAARRVATGELGTKAQVAAKDEVGDLAQAFNQMTESLALSDVQLRQAAEEEARLRGRLETVVNSMGDGLIAVDDEGRIVTYNPAAATILGRSRGQVLGKPLDGVVDIRDAEGRVVRIGEELRRGTAFVQRVDGRLVPVAIVSSPLRDVRRRSFGQVLVLRDMTREHEVDRMKTEFLASVSHELRTPLTPIIGYSELLSDREVPAERVKQFADAMLSSAHRLERIVAILVDFAAMEGGRMRIEAEPTSLSPLVARAVEEWRPRTQQHEFVTRFDPSLPDALVDVSLMRRALDEILDNAVKYSPRGGKVTVSVSSENSRTRRMLRLDVRDEGIGIEPQDLPRIFEDFRQLDASDTRSFGGLGLGLAFVKRIMEAHRGTIDASSVPGEGTTFSLLIPVADTRDGRGTTG
jgi:two-component system sensor histidine kinase ResE